MRTGVETETSPEMGMWVEHLNDRQCWELLERAEVGRLGVLVDSAPEIFPVNHVVDGRTIVFRTDGGTKSRGLDRSPSVCFEVDAVNTRDHTGCSVLVKGRAERVRDDEELGRWSALPLVCWEMGPKTHWIRIVPTEVTGRRIDRIVREDETLLSVREG